MILSMTIKCNTPHNNKNMTLSMTIANETLSKTTLNASYEYAEYLK
jgi:hypothetical protein